jgi:hypothetical protein
MTEYEVQLYTPHEAQMLFHDCDARFRCMNCGRRFGKTVSAANEVCKFACENENTLSWWVAPTYRQARIAYRQMKKALAPLTTRHSDTDLRIELINGAVIECRSADNSDNLRGEGVHFLVVEEAAMLPSKVWYEILRPMLSDTNGRAVFISTPKGRNWFFDIFMRGLDPLRPEYASFTFPTSANPYIPASEVEFARQDLPEDVFRQEYEAVFLEESAGVFRGIDACVYGALDEDAQPVAGHGYVLGWDVAKYQDFSVATIIDTSTLQAVDFWRTNHIDYSFQLDEIERLARKWNAYILMDMTGVGDPLLEQLRLRGLAAEGYLFNNSSKKALIETLQLAFQHRSISIPDVAVLVGELRQMEYKLLPSRLVSYSAPDGAHDDCVISLALAYFAAAKPNVPLHGDNVTQEEITVPTIAEIAQYDPFEYAASHGWSD